MFIITARDFDTNHDLLPPATPRYAHNLSAAQIRMIVDAGKVGIAGEHEVEEITDRHIILVRRDGRGGTRFDITEGVTS